MNSVPRRFRSGLKTALLLVASLWLAGCMTTGGGYGGYPDRYGGNQYGNQYGNQLLGTVQSVNRGYNRIVLTVRDRGRYGRAQQVAIQYDQRTRLRYQGRTLAVEGLERGDVIRVEVVNSRGNLLARSIEVVRNIRDSGGGYGNNADLRGAVIYVDPRRQVIGLNASGYGSNNQVRYDNRTVVEFQGRRYRPENLERGDIVRIQARRYGNQWLAQRIWVERDSTRY